MSDSLWPHGLKHARLPCPLLSPRVQHFLYKLYESIFELFFGLCEHCFAGRWDEYNCAIIWTFFGIAFLWDWNENWPSPVLWPLLSFPNLLTYWVQYFHSIIIIGIPSPPLALFVVMLPKAHLTSHSRISGSRWVITPSWLSGSLRSFCIVLLGILATS